MKSLMFIGVVTKGWSHGTHRPLLNKYSYSTYDLLNNRQELAHFLTVIEYAVSQGQPATVTIGYNSDPTKHMEYVAAAMLREVKSL